MQIPPSFPFTLTFFITDHTDTNTYYCQAVVYDSTTGVILDTVNLDKTSTNDHLFSKVTQAPGDVSGHGRKITVVATAYTDSAYTTKSTLYQEQSESYIVKADKVLGGGGYAGIDYRTIKEIVDDSISKIPKPEKIEIEKPEEDESETPEEPDEEDLMLKSLVEEISVIKGEISQIPKEKVDLTAVLIALSSIKNSVDSIVIPEVDLTPVLDSIDATRNELALINEEQKAHREEKMVDLHNKLPEMIDTHAGNALGRAKFNFNMPFTGAVEGLNSQKKEPVRPQMDINKLMGQ